MSDPDLEAFLEGQVAHSSLEAFVEAQVGVDAAQPPEPPDAPTERLRDLWKELINRAYLREDSRLSIEAAMVLADWNPSLHPRGPDGKFVSRPWDVPDSIKSLGTGEIVRELADNDPDFAEKVDDLAIDGVVEVDDSLDDALERLDRQNISQLEMQRAVDDFAQHAANIRETADVELPLVEMNDDTLPEDGITFDDGATLPPHAAAWELTFEPGRDPDPTVEDLRDQGYLVREKESESGLFEYVVGVTDETPDADMIGEDAGIPEERLSDPLERFEVDRLDEGDQILVDDQQQGAYITDNPQAITIETDDGEFVNVDKPVKVQEVAPESSDDQIPAAADLPGDVADLTQDKIDSAQETYDRFGGDGDFHLEDPSEIDWESIEDQNELAQRLIDVTPVTGMARESDAKKHKGRIQDNLARMQNGQAAVQAANRLDSIEQDRSGGSVGWNNLDDQRGASNTMSLKVSSPESTVDHETAHSIVDGNGVAYDVNVHRAKRYNAGNRKVSWEDTLLSESRDNRELWQYMLTDPDADTDKPPGWDGFSDEIEAEFQDLEDLVNVDDYIRVQNEMGPGPNDSWGDTMERGDVVAIDYRGSEETLLIDEVNQDQFDDGTHQVVATRLPGEAEQKLKMDDDGNFIFGDDRSHVKKFGQQVVSEEDRNPPEVTDPAEELARPAPEDPEERLQEFHEMANKAWYRQAWASTEPGKADTYKIGSQYSLTNGHETVAKMHEEMTNLKEPDRTAALVKNWAEKHPGFFRSYVQNFGLNDTAVDNIQQVISSDRKFGEGDLADGLETLIEGVER